MALQLNDIVNRVNKLLAGELLSFDELKEHLDSVIDDINAKLSSKFPVFTEFNVSDYPEYPNYNLFPDRYIRSVVCLGAAYYFYITDEEGAASAPEYLKQYTYNLFLMQRDYSDKIPEEYRDFETGYFTDPAAAVPDIVDQIWGDI
jgi:hypothetical protein